MSSTVINTWTAFETLAGDLWVKSVNDFPSGLASLKGSRKRITPGNRGKSSSSPLFDNLHVGTEKLSEKSIPLGIIEKITKGRYDLSSMMGDLLVAAGRVKFTSLSSIREAYSLAFDDKSHKLRPYIDEIDDSLAQKGLDAIALVRNLLVHKAGLADEDYIEGQKSGSRAEVIARAATYDGWRTGTLPRRTDHGIGDQTR